MTIEAIRPQPPRQSPADLPSQSLFGHYLAALWSRRVLIVLFTLLCGAVSFTSSWFTEPMFEATGTLVVSPMKAGNPTELVQSVTTGNFIRMVQNRELAAKVVKEFQLDKPPAGLTAEDFVSRVISVEEVRGTTLLNVSVRLHDPKVAASVTNRAMEWVVERNRALEQQESVYAVDYLKEQVAKARVNKDQAEAVLLDYKQHAQVELHRRDMDTLLLQRADLVKVTLELESEKSRLAAARTEIGTRDKIMTVKRSLGDGPGPGRDLTLTSELTNQFADPVYESLDGQIAYGATKVAALEGQRAEMLRRYGVNERDAAQLSDLYAKELKQAKLQTDFDIAKVAYVDISNRSEQAHVQVAARTAGVQIFESAMAPERPFAPRPTQGLALALFAALSVSVVAVLVWHSISLALGGSALR